VITRKLNRGVFGVRVAATRAAHAHAAVPAAAAQAHAAVPAAAAKHRTAAATDASVNRGHT